MKNFFILSVIGFCLSLGSIHAAAGDRIDMGVSPIVDEFRIERGQTLNRSVKFLNNSDIAYTVYISTEDCTPGANYGTPKCTPFSGSGVDIEKASTWITSSVTGNFTVPARGSRTIPYTITAPSGAVPGGHYGAIFFNNPDQNGANGNSVSMVRRIGMLFMVTVSGSIIVDTQFGDILIDGPGGGISNPTGGISPIPTLWSAPQQYLSEKLRRFMMVFTDPEESTRILAEINPIWKKPNLEEIDFSVGLKIPVRNDGNTHIRPTGKIYLYETDGNQLKQIGKISLVDENGVYLGEKIVDYLPINDEGGNVLPNTERIFQINWNGFAYNTVNTAGQTDIVFESPGSYYTKLSEGGSLIYPWEKFALRNAEKILTAKVEISYKNPKTDTDEIRNLELPLNIEYTFVAKTFNWSAILLLLCIIFAGWTLTRKKRKKSKAVQDEDTFFEDEIRVLEKAQKNLTLTGIKKKKATVEKTKTVNTTAKKQLKSKSENPTISTQEKKETPKKGEITKKPVKKTSSQKTSPKKSGK